MWNLPPSTGWNLCPCIRRQTLLVQGSPRKLRRVRAEIPRCWITPLLESKDWHLDCMQQEKSYGNILTEEINTNKIDFLVLLVLHRHRFKWWELWRCVLKWVKKTHISMRLFWKTKRLSDFMIIHNVWYKPARGKTLKIMAQSKISTHIILLTNYCLFAGPSSAHVFTIWLKNQPLFQLFCYQSTQWWP